jgi:predicted aspartyl protease
LTVNPIIIHYEDKPFKVITTSIITQAKEYCQIFELALHPMKVTALWDTGADGCAISRVTAEKMGLTPFGTRLVDGFWGSSKSEVYYVDITLSDERHVYNVPAVVYDGLSAQDFVIGMNVITMGDFALTREDGGTRFSFSME